MSRRVFILWTNLLFYEAIQVILDHTDVEVAGSSSLPAARAEIENFHPHTVIVEELESTIDTNAEVVNILESCAWDPRILRLSIRNNELIVYQREHRIVERAEDLLNLI